MREALLAYYRAYSGDPNVVEQADLDKAQYDWLNNIIVPGFDSPITTQEFQALGDELNRPAQPRWGWLVALGLGGIAILAFLGKKR